MDAFAFESGAGPSASLFLSSVWISKIIPKFHAHDQEVTRELYTQNQAHPAGFPLQNSLESIPSSPSLVKGKSVATVDSNRHSGDLPKSVPGVCVKVGGTRPEV